MAKPRNVREAMGLITTVTTALQAQLENAEHEDLMLNLPESVKSWLARDFAYDLTQAGKYHAYITGSKPLEIMGVDSNRTVRLVNNLTGEVKFYSKQIINPSLSLPDPESYKDLKLKVHRTPDWAVNFEKAVESLHKSGLRPAAGWEAVWFLTKLMTYQRFAREPEIINVVDEKFVYRISFTRNDVQFVEWGSTYCMKEDNIMPGSLFLGVLKE